MTTLPYNLGEPSTLGFPIDDATGAPMDLLGLQLRLVVSLNGADLLITGYAGAGEVLPPGETEMVAHPSIAFFDLTDGNFPLQPRLYPCSVQRNDGTGWRTFDGHDHFIKAWRR